MKVWLFESDADIFFSDAHVDQLCFWLVVDLIAVDDHLDIVVLKVGGIGELVDEIIPLHRARITVVRPYLGILRGYFPVMV
jgi:hypothetical protein